MHEVDQVAQVMAEPVELPRHQCIALPQRLEARLQTRPIIALAGRLVFVEVRRLILAASTHHVADRSPGCRRPSGHVCRPVTVKLCAMASAENLRLAVSV